MSIKNISIQTCSMVNFGEYAFSVFGASRVIKLL